jgi:hypothetical protein
MHLLSIPLHELAIVGTIYHNILRVEHMIEGSEAFSQNNVGAVKSDPFLGLVDGAVM